MTTTHLERAVLVTAILDTGKEENIVIIPNPRHKTMIKVTHEGFVSVDVSSISRAEISELPKVYKTDEAEVNLNKIWGYTPKELDYFSVHENQ